MSSLALAHSTRDTPASAKAVLATINRSFGTLPWCRRYLERTGETGYLYGLQRLVREGIVQEYPPLKDQAGSMTAQFVRCFLHFALIISPGILCCC